MVEGYGRERGPQQDSRSPLIPEVLSRMMGQLPGICADSYELALFRATSAVVFFTALRVGELVASGKGDKSGTVLQVSDVTIMSNNLKLWIRKSKMDQVGRGEDVVLGVTAEALERLGVKGIRFAMHPFRIGAASTAAALGYSPEDIKRSVGGGPSTIEHIFACYPFCDCSRQDG
ncbi:hypothetical protein JRQ81_012280 [Phrynocephalus forsythii]|uniref:Uncharacterized protein n=1 Tax=Phrynocephalus forsythii TaxID=171643 RepID=A0A9Q0Y214_9SAUR|nr:hypothetical protein JRQ81_012280 [Phrynocephalus forsythii]